MATQYFKRNLPLNLYREGKKILLVCFLLLLKRDKNVWHLQAISSIWRPLCPWGPLDFLSTCLGNDSLTGFRKGRGTRDCTVNIQWIIKKARNSRKTPSSALVTMLKPLTVLSTIQCWHFLKWWEYQITWPAFWEICMQVRKQQWELNNRLVPNRKRSSSRLYTVTLFI